MTTASMAQRLAGSSWRIDPTSLVRRFGVVLALLVLLVFLALKSPPFFSLQNFSNILGQWAAVGIMAAGMTYVLVAGGFDLSIGSGFGLCAVVTALLGKQGYPPSLCFLASALVGCAIGLVNAALVVRLKINPFMATLGVDFALSSMPFVIVANPYIQVEQPGFDELGTGSLAGIPYAGILLVAVMLTLGIILAYTKYGHYLYAVGGNPEISRLFGIPVGVVTGSTYVVSGLCVGAAAALSTSQLSYSASEQDPALVFDVIVAVVIGGTSLAGGIGSLWQTAVGLAVLAALQNGLNLLEISTFFQYIVKGSIIIGALGLDVWTRWLAERRRFMSSQPAGRVSGDAPGRAGR